MMSNTIQIDMSALTKSYLASGLSIIPCGNNKRPLASSLPNGEWKGYQSAPASQTELDIWLKRGMPAIAVVCGNVSGGLEIIDFDVDGYYERWVAAVGSAADGLPVQRTGGGGYQVAFRSDSAEGNQKLAYHPDESMHQGRTVAIETRGEGGYALLPPSIHPSGGTYEVVSGDFANIPTVSSDVRAKMLESARALCQAPLTRQQIDNKNKRPVASSSVRQPVNGDSVIDAYNAEHNIVDVIVSYGYTEGSNGRYSRPGEPSSNGVHILLDRNKTYNHSSNDPLDSDMDGKRQPRAPFDYYCHFKHNGDYKSAVREAAIELGMNALRNGHGAPPPVDVAELEPPPWGENVDVLGFENWSQSGGSPLIAEVHKENGNVPPSEDVPNFGPPRVDELPMWMGEEASQDELGEFDFLKYDVSDLGDGECFADYYRGKYSYVEEWGWLHFDGKSWDTEGSHLVRKGVRDVIRKRRDAAKKQLPSAKNKLKEIEKAAEKESDPAKLESIVEEHEAQKSIIDRLVKIITRVSKCSKGQLFGTADCAAVDMAETTERFSCAPHLINVNNGILDLRTGELTKHDHESGMMHIINVDYNPDADCNEWCEWLEDIFEDNDTLAFFQAYCGYMLTGYTSDERLLYVRGETRSGKGTIQTVLQEVLGRKLSGGIPFNTFTRDRGDDGNRFDLAPLKDKRAIFASESEPGRRLNSAEVKTITGGDPIYCAYKGKDMFEYVPQFKISLFSNFPASGDPEDDALWSRLACIDMKKSFLGKEDTTLKQRLTSKENLEAVLCWLVDGAKNWIKLRDRGLRLPEAKAMKDIKSAWRGDLDHIRNWIEEYCYTEKSDAFTSNGDLYNSYETYCRDNGVEPKKANAFARSLKTKGYESGRQSIAGKRQKGFIGIGISL